MGFFCLLKYYPYISDMKIGTLSINDNGHKVKDGDNGKVIYHLLLETGEDVNTLFANNKNVVKLCLETMN